MIHKYNYVRIKQKIQRTDDVISLILEKPDDFYYHPGQFIMLWVPEVNEKPFAVSDIAQDSIEITIRAIGEFTLKVSELREGEGAGIRGPFGRGFELVSRNDSAIVAGGVGIACMSLLALNNPAIPLLYGSRSRRDIIFPRRFQNCIYATDDGSLGEKGFITDIFREYAGNNRLKSVYACGPEKMLQVLLDICRKLDIKLYASLERYMKCGVGICGQCAIDDRITCIDGPVFDDISLSKLREFGKYKYNKSGQREEI